MAGKSTVSVLQLVRGGKELMGLETVLKFEAKVQMNLCEFEYVYDLFL